jgi:hypothetical protein
VPKEVTGNGNGNEALDPPPSHHHSRAFPEDEVTPPAVDVDELRAQEKSQR